MISARSRKLSSLRLTLWGQDVRRNTNHTLQQQLWWPLNRNMAPTGPKVTHQQSTTNQQLVCSGKVWGEAIKSFTAIETKDSDRWWYYSLMKYVEILLPDIPVYRSALKVVHSENSKIWITFRCRFLFWPTFAWPAALHGEVSQARTKPEEFPEKMPKTKTKSNEEKNVTRAVNYCTKRRLSNQIRLFATIWFVGSCVSTSDWIS